MRIVIDLQAAQNDSSFRGVGRYCRSLAREMARKAVDQGDEVILLLNSNFAESIPLLVRDFKSLVPRENVVVFDGGGDVTETIPENIPRLRVAEATRESVIAQLKPDVVHLSSLFEGSVDGAVTSVGRSGIDIPTAITLYDLIPLVLKDLYITSPEYAVFYNSKLESLRRARSLLAISEHSRVEAINLLGFAPEQIVNISAAVDSIFKPTEYSVEQKLDVTTRYGINKPFLLYMPGGFDPRKNFENLFRAFAALPTRFRDTYQLVIGSNIQPDVRADLERKISATGLTASSVIITGYVPESELVALYNLCELHVFPSLYEGFGLPALEAMACGAPSIGSNTSSLPEVIGRFDALFDPSSPESIAAKMTEAIEDLNFRASLRSHALQHASNFSWNRSADIALKKLKCDFGTRRSIPDRESR